MENNPSNDNKFGILYMTLRFDEIFLLFTAQLLFENRGHFW